MEYITKDKMQTGQVALLEDGAVTMVMKVNDVVYLIDSNGYSSVYDPYMNCDVEGMEELSVAKVYDTTPTFWVNVFLKHNIELSLDQPCWKLKDTGLVRRKVKKLTLKEIEDLLGYKIELV